MPRSADTNGRTPRRIERTLELFVIEGPDAGSQFTVDGE